MTFTTRQGVTTCDSCGVTIRPGVGPTSALRAKTEHDALHNLAANPDAPTWLQSARQRNLNRIKETA